MGAHVCLLTEEQSRAGEERLGRVGALLLTVPTSAARSQCYSGARCPQNPCRVASSFRGLEIGETIYPGSVMV